MRGLKFLIVAGIAFILAGCISVPGEAPELSAELGKRISALEAANMTLLARYFDQKRSEVDDFIDEEWIPEFAEKFFSDDFMASAWDTIVRENDKRERLEFLIRTGPRLQERINAKRQELIKPLDDLERQIQSELKREYDQARAINNSITGFLVSASKVARNRDRYLAMVGVTDAKVGALIDQTDAAVEDLVNKANNTADKVARGEAFLEKIKDIRSSL